MTEPMTGKELAGRLSKGEDPLDLSIEKWERVVGEMQDGVSYNELLGMGSFGVMTCGICIISDDCSECPYHQYFDQVCFSKIHDAPYGDFMESHHIDDAKRVIEALQQIKEGR